MNKLWNKLKRWFIEMGSPPLFYNWSSKIIPWLGLLTLLVLLIGLYWGLFVSPMDYKQGDVYRIIYIHVPSAFLAINIYLMMFVASLIWLIRRHHLSALAAKAAAPIGLSMTVVAISTGALWGQPTWGTYWVWDPRLTSFAILTLFYIGYILLSIAVEPIDKAADLTSVLCLIGSIFALLSRYAVFFWDQGLHQGASLSLDKEKNVADVFYQPLLLSITGFTCFFIFLVLIRTETELLKIKLKSIVDNR